MPMATCFSHPAVPLAIVCWFPSLRRRSLLVAASLLSAAPDLDAFGYFSGVPYEAWCGHRGCTHSLLCAGVVAALLTPRLAARSGVPKARVAAFLFAACASHGVVDMATNGGHGIALLWPFTDERWFWPWQPIEVAPLGIRAFFSAWGVEVLASEFVWLWLPAIVLGAIGLCLRRPRPGATCAPTGSITSAGSSRALVRSPAARPRDAHEDDLRARCVRVDDVEDAVEPEGGLGRGGRVHGVLSIDVAADRHAVVLGLLQFRDQTARPRPRRS